MSKRIKKYSFKKGQKIHVDLVYQIGRELELDTHFEKVPDENLGEYGNENYESLSEIEQCIKPMKLTIIVED